MKWTKKAAIQRMRTHQELQQVYEKYPLTRFLVESATAVQAYPGYHRISFYYAYKDWMWAATGDENKAFWVCVKVIDDLLPPDSSDLELEGVPCIVEDNPPLPGLPKRPNRVAHQPEGRGKFRVYTLTEWEAEVEPRERQRQAEMHEILQQIKKVREAYE